MKVLFIVTHTPDYRESFLRLLGSQVELTVVAQPCDISGLASPDQRRGYEYIEVPATSLGGLSWQPRLARILDRTHWDVVCAGLNLRQVSRLWQFVRARRYHRQWIWWGHVFGRSSSLLTERLRRYLLRQGAFCLTYNEPTARAVKSMYGVPAVSFNNTEVSLDEFRPGKFETSDELRLLFVGRNQLRKKLERLVELAQRHDDVRVRLVGPGMEHLNIPSELQRSRRLEVFGRTRGEELAEHFDWAHLVANPGHVGLLAMNAARHGKGIVVDAASSHAPEYYLAEEAGQPFIQFGDPTAVDAFLQEIRQNRRKLESWGRTLQDVARKRYTVEHMVEVHLEVFSLLATRHG